jgi:hypothetical protein
MPTKYINKKFVIISFCAAILLCAVLLFLGDSNLYRLSISNGTGEVILLEGAVVDGKSIYKGGHKIPPRNQSRYDHADYALIKIQQANEPKILELFVRTADDSKTARYSCKLEKKKQDEGCIFVVNIRDTKDITCFCQPIPRDDH